MQSQAWTIVTSQLSIAFQFTFETFRGKLGHASPQDTKDGSLQAHGAEQLQLVRDGIC